MHQRKNTYLRQGSERDTINYIALLIKQNNAVGIGCSMDGVYLLVYVVMVVVVAA